MAFSKELLRGLALFGEKSASCHSGLDLVQLTDKRVYWESEARSCREGLRGFFRCEAFLEICQSQLRWSFVLLFARLVLGLCAGYILGSLIQRDFARQGRTVTATSAPKV